MYILPEVIVFWDANFDGESWTTSFPVGWGWSYVGDHWNDQISSVIVRCGQWQFFLDANMGGNSTTVGPGCYTFVENMPFNFPNDAISSFQCVGDWDQGDGASNVF
jgi:Beta/Gamma crystallin